MAKHLKREREKAFSYIHEITSFDIMIQLGNGRG